MRSTVGECAQRVSELGAERVVVLREFTGEPATEPIRAYAGMGTAEDVEERAQLAVDDLERAGGFERAYLLIVTTTGSGWVVPSSVEAFEYMTGGDSAIVAMQYSYLPSWISYLVDQERARDAGRELYDAVYERWSALPADDRPQLLVFGESLGSFGAETAFSGEFDLANRTDGALLVGPPSFNTLYREFTDDREAGSPEIEPIYRDGGSFGSPIASKKNCRPRTSRGPARGSCTCSTRPTQSCGGVRRCCSTGRPGSRRNRVRTCWTR